MKAVVLNNLGWFLVGTGCGIFAGAYLAQRHLEKEYDARLYEELGVAKQYYAKLSKRDEYSSPTTLVDESNEDARPKEDEEPWTGTPTPKASSSEDDRAKYSNFDYRREMPKRKSGVPYVISREEFDENPKDYDQRALTYFSKDDVVIDEQDTPIGDVLGLLGPVALDQFGNGSHDPNIVYVRNDFLSMDFEVCYDPDSFEETVLGHIKHGNDHKIRKFRLDDD